MYIGLTLGCLLVLLIGEQRGVFWLRAVAKAGASTGFLLVAHEAGALGSPQGRLFFVGLALSWFGDVFLLSRRHGWFLAGLIAFLVGHVAYAGAFLARGADFAWLLGVLAALMVPGLLVLRWLWPTLGKMRRPVIAYVAVISVMLAAAITSHLGRASVGLLVGAVLFYLSDLCVARERFASTGFVNRLVGLPLYYAGQLFLAHYALS